MSDGLLEAVFQDNFQVIRRKEQVDQKGRSQITPTSFNPIGVVCAASPNDLMRLGDYEYQGSALSIVTRFKLRGVAKQQGQNYQPDILIWNNSAYLVVTVEDYARYGSGFIQAIAVSTTYVDPPTPPNGDVISSLDFSNPANSGLLACFSL